MILKRKLKLKFSILIIIMFMLNIFSAQLAMALNASGNKSSNFQGYRYIDNHTIQVWFDKNTPVANPPNQPMAQLKIIEGTNLNGRQLQIQSVAAGSGSNVNGVSGLSGAASFVITTASSDAFTPGTVYTVVLNNTIKSNNGLTLGNFNFRRDIIFNFVAPDTSANPNGNGTYAATAQGLVTTLPTNNSTNVPLEGNIWFAVNVPVQNYSAVQSGLVLKKNGVALTLDHTINTSKDGDIYAPLFSDDHTFFFFPMTGGGSNTSYNLDPNATYELSIPAMTLINGQTIAAQTFTFTTTADITPTKMGAISTSVNGDQLNVTWPASIALYDTSNNLISPGATGYNVYASQDPYWNYVKLNSSPVTATSYTASGLTPQTNYYFRVTPVNNSSEGGFSDYVAATTPADITTPSWPIDSSLTTTNVSDYGLTLNWKAATDNIGVTGYRIYRNGILIDTVSGSTASYNLTGLAASTQYNFKVEAGDNAGLWSTDGPAVTIATSTAPDTKAPTWPTGSKITYTNVSQTGLTLKWTPATDNVAVNGYRIYKNGVLKDTVNGSTTSYDVTGLTANTQYTFKIEAGDAAGNWSNNGPVATVTTLAAPVIPTPTPTTPLAPSPQPNPISTEPKKVYAGQLILSGVSGPSVSTVQDKLKSLGIDCGASDGVFGPQTLNAVKSFQAAYGLVPDGIVGPLTWCKMFGFNVGNYTNLITYGNTTPTVVGGIQDKLISLGFNPGPLDGKFGPRTLAAIKGFQKAHGLVVDGIIGPITWKALFG